MVRIEIEIEGKKFPVETHDLPLHLDEMVSCFLLEEYADSEFLKKHAPEGVIRIGVGGGEFDEHPTQTSERKEGECAATLVAKALGVEDEPGLKRILRFTLSRDLKGGGSPFDLAAITKLVSESFSPQDTYEWVKKFLKIRYEQDLAFETSTKDEYQKIAKEVVVPVGQKQLKIVVLESDDPLVKKFALSLEGGGAVAIQKWPSGHVQIFANRQRLGNGLDDVARMVRLAEQSRKRKKQIRATDRDRLASEGIVPGAEEWYYHRAGTALLNGRSPDKWGVPPTNLPLDQIVRIVKLGIDPLYFPQHCPKSRCIFERCGWYGWGLDRCQKIQRR
jgi:hypothetical protein